MGAAFVGRAREYLDVEYRTKVRAAVEALPPGALWHRPNERSNSAGNLLLHLAGNLRQWVVSGIGGTADTRDRPAEFAAREGATAHELLADLDRALDEVDRVLASLTPDDLPQRRLVQGRDLTVADIVFHVVEHFAYHLGQLVWLAKARAPGAIQFYDDAEGLARPTWPDRTRPR